MREPVCAHVKESKHVDFRWSLVDVINDGVCVFMFQLSGYGASRKMTLFPCVCIKTKNTSTHFCFLKKAKASRVYFPPSSFLHRKFRKAFATKNNSNLIKSNNLFDIQAMSEWISLLWKEQWLHKRLHSYFIKCNDNEQESPDSFIGFIGQGKRRQPKSIKRKFLTSLLDNLLGFPYLQGC